MSRSWVSDGLLDPLSGKRVERIRPCVDRCVVALVSIQSYPSIPSRGPLVLGAPHTLQVVPYCQFDDGSERIDSNLTLQFNALGSQRSAYRSSGLLFA